MKDQYKKILEVKKNKELLIKRLESCDSADILGVILSDFNKQENNRAFYSSLRPTRLKNFKELDNKIESLIKAKKQKFEVPIRTKTQESVAIDNCGNDQLSDNNSTLVDVRMGEKLALVRENLDILLLKKNELMKKSLAGEGDYVRASASANVLWDKIWSLYEQCILHKPNEIDIVTFKRQAKEILNHDNNDVKELNKHRGWKQVVTNLLTAILGVGVVYGIAAAIKGSFTLFPVATDSGSKLKVLEQSIDDLVDISAPIALP